MSPDLRDHAVSYFLEPLLENHDCQQFEVTCYSNSIKEDAVTKRLRSNVHRWRMIYGKPDEQVDEMVRKDQIDVLIDLAAHSSGGRLELFARHPAPVQLTYLGYPGTTGLDEMDYKLTDRYIDPPASVKASL